MSSSTQQTPLFRTDRIRVHHVSIFMFLTSQTSSLDAHAQNRIFDTVETLSRCPATGERTKSVVFITHRLSTARRADKIAMMEHGVSSFPMRGPGLFSLLNLRSTDLAPF